MQQRQQVFLLKHEKFWLQLENLQFFHQYKIQYRPYQFSHLCILLPKHDCQENVAANILEYVIDNQRPKWNLMHILNCFNLCSATCIMFGSLHTHTKSLQSAHTNTNQYILNESYMTSPTFATKGSNFETSNLYSDRNLQANKISSYKMTKNMNNQRREDTKLKNSTKDFTFSQI